MNHPWNLSCLNHSALMLTAGIDFGNHPIRDMLKPKGLSIQIRVKYTAIYGGICGDIEWHELIVLFILLDY